jgi:hypothetical protein
VAVFLTGSPSIDPAIQAVDILPAIWRVCDMNQDGYGRRVYVDAASDDQQVRYDPLRVMWKSKRLMLREEFNNQISRGFFLDYMKEGLDPLYVQVWVDERLQRTVEFPPTAGRAVTSPLRALPTPSNVGTVLQFMVDETSIDPWFVNSVGIKMIAKGHRG